MNERERADVEAAPVAGAGSKPNVVRIALFAILGIMVVALVYEYGFVRGPYLTAQTTIDDLIDASRARGSKGVPSPEVVQAAMGRAPVDGLQDKGDYYLEHYRWRRWLPWKTYSIWVIYTHTDPPQLYHTTRPNPPSTADLPLERDWMGELARHASAGEVELASASVSPAPAAGGDRVADASPPDAPSTPDGMDD